MLPAQELIDEAAALRKMADKLWDSGDKNGAGELHRKARTLGPAICNALGKHQLFKSHGPERCVRCQKVIQHVI